MIDFMLNVLITHTYIIDNPILIKGNEYFCNTYNLNDHLISHISFLGHPYLNKTSNLNATTL
jgi:hypothetical protein